MNQLHAVSQYAIHLIGRELQELLDRASAPYRLRREIELLVYRAPSPLLLWRAIDRVLEAYMAPPVLRERVERVIERSLAMSSRELQIQTSLTGDFDVYDRGWIGAGSGYGLAPWRGGHGGWSGSGYPYGQPMAGGTEVPVDVIEREHDVLVRLALPGVRPDEVEARITDDDVLVVRALRWGNVVTRAVPMPPSIEPRRMQSLFEDGILEVSIAKQVGARSYPVGPRGRRPLYANGAINSIYAG